MANTIQTQTGTVETISVFQKYPNLPGFMAEFRDGGLVARTSTRRTGTESILFIGTAIDGPVGEPVAVDPDTVELVFGQALNPNGVPNGASLVRAFYEAYDAGCRDIRLMRATGSTAVAKIGGADQIDTNYTPVTDKLGAAPGNGATTFTLSNTTVQDVAVFAEGKQLASTTFTVTQGTSGGKATVALKANVTNPEAEIYITYNVKTTVSGKTVLTSYTDNKTVAADGTATFFTAAGGSSTFTLSQNPYVDAGIHIYANGIEIDEAGLTITGKTVVVASGYAPKDALLEASYLQEEKLLTSLTLKLETRFGGSVYNQFKVSLQDITVGSGATLQTLAKKLVITKPDSKKYQDTEPPVEFSSYDYPTLGQLVQAINDSDDLEGMIVASVARSDEGVDMMQLDKNKVTSFNGGSDGLNVSVFDLYDLLGGTRDREGRIIDPGLYQTLENYTVDMIVPLGVYADTQLAGKYDNFAYQLALACAVISHRNKAVLGVIGTTTPDETGLVAVQAQVDKLVDLAANDAFYMRDRAGNILKDSTGKTIDLGRFIQIVAGPEFLVSSDILGQYSAMPAASYAGFVSRLRRQSSPMNKRLSFVDGLRFTYSSRQLDALTEARYVTFGLKANGTQVTVIDAPTAAQPESDYRRLTTIRVVKEAVNEVRAVCDPYIGEPNEVAQRNAMSAAISKRLTALKTAGVIKNYSFRIVSDAAMQLVGQARIELTIVPPQELREVTLLVSLTR